MEENRPKKSRKRRLVKYLFFILFLVLVILAVAYFIHKVDQPVSSTVTSRLGSVNSNSYNIDLTPVRRTGTYASFDSPKGVGLKSTALSSPISVEDFYFYTKDVYSWTLAVEVIRTGTGQLSESSSYETRYKNPSTYSQSIEEINHQTVYVMTDTSFTEGFSKVAYLTHGDLIGTVSLIGNDTSGIGPLVTTFNMVLSTWTWN